MMLECPTQVVASSVPVCVNGRVLLLLLVSGLKNYCNFRIVVIGAPCASRLCVLRTRTLVFSTENDVHVQTRQRKRGLLTPAQSQPRLGLVVRCGDVTL